VTSIALELARWAREYEPNQDDLDLAERSLLDTISVAVAGRNESAVEVASHLSEAARWAVAGHILDFDDLHMESTSHISVVCVPAVLAVSGGPRDYLVGAGVMARLGVALGWNHYAAGWHITCTTGAFGAAIGSGVALGLNSEQLAVALALAVPAAGGVQRAFGTDSKSLQVGFAAEAGVRAAQLAAKGSTADPRALDAWMQLMGANPADIDLSGPAIPGGLAIKMYPCCYALQRPISAISELSKDGIDTQKIEKIIIHTPSSSVAPLIHHDPKTSLEGKFSMEYAVATALLDSHQIFFNFSDSGVQRPQARHLMELVQIELSKGGDWLLEGEFEVEIYVGGDVIRTRSQFPPGSPQRPATYQELSTKARECLAGTSKSPEDINWETARDVLIEYV